MIKTFNNEPISVESLRDNRWGNAFEMFVRLGEEYLASDTSYISHKSLLYMIIEVEKYECMPLSISSPAVLYHINSFNIIDVVLSTSEAKRILKLIHL